MSGHEWIGRRILDHGDVVLIQPAAMMAVISQGLPKRWRDDNRFGLGAEAGLAMVSAVTFVRVRIDIGKKQGSRLDKGSA